MQPLPGWRRGAPLSFALATSVLALSACGGKKSGEPSNPPRTQLSAEIRRTSFGIPHIKANDEAGLGYGIGYAYAEDNACLLAEEILTVNGERSKYFDPRTASYPVENAPSNLDSDFFYLAVNSEAAVNAALNAQSTAVRELLRGYVAGFNAWLDQPQSGTVNAMCRNQPWLRKIKEQDLARLMRRTAMSNGSVGFVGGIGAAQPPGTAQAAPAAAAVIPAARPRRTASNGLAVGGERSENGRGIVLGQPHLAWLNNSRFYEMHLTIPGKLDVMGASLPGLPVVGIGFTQNFAWTHTTDTSAHATFYALQLDSKDPTRYMVDGQSIAMGRREISVEARNGDGRLVKQTRTLYTTEYGPLVQVPEMELNWSASRAFALRDANADNHRMLEQWYAMNKASSLEELKQLNQRIVGNPWNNTLAADKEGRTLFMNVSPVANLPTLAQCQLPQPAYLDAQNAFTLDGSRKACNWVDDAGAPQAGIMAGSRLPVLENRDYVQNANDSAWLANPATPLTGFSPLVSKQGAVQGMRTRQMLTELQSRPKKLGMADLQDMALNNKVYLMQAVQDDLKPFCASRSWQPDAGRACAALGGWDGRANLDSDLAYVYLRGIWAGTLSRMQGDAAIWAVPFNAADPVHTPRGLRYRDPALAEALSLALDGVIASLNAKGVPLAAKLGEVQVATVNGRRIGIHGGADLMGVLNAIETDAPANGVFEVQAGTTYLQVVGFDAQGPVAQTLLAYSQSSDPSSPHRSDQTDRFSRKQWIALPFREAAILADPGYRSKTIKQ
ncbi:penicillin acylase family protein [Pseudoduganella violacea]|uniref:Acyl-homoserine-lactone acylase n=1 Tax=Pseudoduganella violacea TaxID=1715466 RepID=A0A7W5FVS3_9BURK|nr:penicillin acylase family protein [Pseudoduganella violacea]MBB3121310.1 acyl-homoserine-lactone acylase [Pseudoduganella violacea]